MKKIIIPGLVLTILVLMFGSTKCVTHKLSNTKPEDKNCIYNTNTKDVRCENNKIYANIVSINPGGLGGRPDPKYINSIGSYEVASSKPNMAMETVWVCQGPDQCHE